MHGVRFYTIFVLTKQLKMKYIRKTINKSIISEDLGITVHIERIQKTKNQVFWYPYAEKDGQKYRIAKVNYAYKEDAVRVAKRYFAYKREQI